MTEEEREEETRSLETEARLKRMKMMTPEERERELDDRSDYELWLSDIISVILAIMTMAGIVMVPLSILMRDMNMFLLGFLMAMFGGMTVASYIRTNDYKKTFFLMGILIGTIVLLIYGNMD